MHGVAVVSTVVAVTTACGGSNSSAKGTASAPTTPSTTADPWAVPATITPDYINRVLAKLDQAEGDALRSVRSSNTITPQFVAVERAIRASEHERQLETDLQIKSINAGWPNTKPMPGNRRSMVARLLRAEPSCVEAATAEDFSAVTLSTPTPYPQWYITLVPAEPNDLNPTHWRFSYDGYESTGQVPAPACGNSQ